MMGVTTIRPGIFFIAVFFNGGVVEGKTRC
jgi:hypothetical protein